MTKHSSLKYIDVPMNTSQDWNTLPKRIPKAQLKRVNNIEEIEKIYNRKKQTKLEPGRRNSVYEITFTINTGKRCMH